MAVNREQVVQAAEKLVAKGKIEAAIKEYRKVLEDSPSDTTTLNRVGDLWARLNKNDEAIKVYTQTAASFSEDGFFVKAIAIYKKVIKLDPTRLEVYEKLADLYHRQGLTNEARTQYQVLIDYYLKHSNAARRFRSCSRWCSSSPRTRRTTSSLPTSTSSRSSSTRRWASTR
jgi:tetratricopeptide (TPR) repeat protein